MCVITLRKLGESVTTQVVKTIAMGFQSSPVRPAAQTVAIHAGNLEVQRRSGQASDGERSRCRRETGMEPVRSRLKRCRRANLQVHRTERSVRVPDGGLWGASFSAVLFRVGIRHSAQEQDRAGAGVADEEDEKSVDRHHNGFFAGT